MTPALAVAPSLPAPAGSLTAPSTASGLVDCTEIRTDATPDPLAPRPTVRRKTLAAKSTGHRKRRPAARKPGVKSALRKPVKKQTIAARKTVKKATIARKAPPRRGPRRAAARPTQLAQVKPLIRKLTYSSPLCFNRVAAFDRTLSDLPIIDAINAPTEAPIAPDQLALGPVGPFTGVFPGGGGNGGGGNGPFFPGFPGIFLPPVVGGGGGGGGETGTEPGTPGGPDTPIAPPVGEVPEPASWAMLILGFGLVGSAIRRRRALAA